MGNPGGNFPKNLRAIAVVLVLLTLIYVALSPQVVYAPTPRAVLYLLASAFVGVLIGADAATRFEMKLGPFLLVTTGAAGLTLATFVLLTHFSKPEQRIAVFRVVDEINQPVNLDPAGLLVVPTMQIGLSATHFVKRDTIVLIFPEQLPSQELRVRKTSDGREYVGPVSYAGSGSFTLKLGEHLKLK